MISMQPQKPSTCKIQFLLEIFQPYYENQDYKSVLDDLGKFFHSHRFNSVELVSVLRKKYKFSLKDDKFTPKDSYTCSKKLVQDDEPCFDLWTGLVEVNRSHLGLLEVINVLMEPVVPLESISLSNGDTSMSTTAVSKKNGYLWKIIGNNEYLEFNNFRKDQVAHTFNPEDFGFGTMINGTIFVEHFNSSNQTANHLNRINLSIKHTFGKMVLFFYVNDSKENNLNFMLEFDYKSINSVTITRSKSGFTIYFHLKNPPKIKKKSKKESWSRWHDCKYLTSDCIGKSSVFSLNLEDKVKADDIIYTFNKWRQYSPLNVSFGSIETIQAVAHPVNQYLELQFDVRYALCCVESISFAFQDDLNFNNQFDNLMTFIREHINTNTERLIAAINKLCYDYYHHRKVYCAISKLITIFNRIENDTITIENTKQASNSHIKQLRRCIITPTRLLFLPELQFQTSQFLEIAERDCVLRALIRDEDFDSLSYAVFRDPEETKREKKIKRSKRESAHPFELGGYFLRRVFADRLLPHLKVAGKIYDIYGASSSQIREYGLVLYAKDSKGRNVDDMRNAIGLVKDKLILKQMKRHGLSLTQVLAFIDLPPDTQIRYTKDVLAGKHSDSGEPYNFTDGCGLMSYEIAQYIWKDLKSQGAIKVNPNEQEEIASAYQIRFMGCKGMLVLDITLSGKVIVLRESMRKLASPFGQLGIVKISAPRRAFLNRPFVTILNQIGLSNEFFVGLLFDAISDLVDSFHCNSKASKALNEFSQLHRFINHSKLAELGYDLLGDPFFRSSLDLVFHEGLDIIKKKTRIPLDKKISRTLFGVTDPTGTHHLPYAVVPNHSEKSPDAHMVKIYDHEGQIIHSSPGEIKWPLFFDERTENVLQTATEKSFEYRKGVLKYGQVFFFPSDFEKPITGNVLVVKFPCMHPGDVRVFEAVDVPDLYRIRDSIAFPIDGPRPHPDEMAGSDLDGDEYCVIWSPDFLNIQNHPPMEFPVGSSGESGNLNNNKIVDFYVDYILDDPVGKYASSNLVCADLFGIFDDRCKKYAKIFSMCLDGVKAGFSEMLSENEICHEAPDHMQNWNRKRCYHSTRALGAIYRTITMFELFLAEETSKLKVIEPLIDPRIDHPDWKKYERQALKQYEMYRSIVTHFLESNEISNEIELFTQISEKSFMLGSTDVKIQRPTEYQDMIYQVDFLLVKSMEKNFYEEFSLPEWQNKSESELQEACMAKAAAIYKISILKTKHDKKQFSGLPWIGKYSNHIFELLKRNSYPNLELEKRRIAKLNTPTTKGGFSGNANDCSREADLCWKTLNGWLTSYLISMRVPKNEFRKVIDKVHNLFYRIVPYYISGDRRKKSPGLVLREIFTQIKSKQKSLNFETNIFDSCNDPIGLMIILILERKYYEGTLMRKSLDGSFNCWRTGSYNVSIGEDSENEEILKFTSLVESVSGCESILCTPLNSESCKFTVFGSPASILICQTIFGLHNRLKSSY